MVGLIHRIAVGVCLVALPLELFALCFLATAYGVISPFIAGGLGGCCAIVEMRILCVEIWEV